MPNKFVFWKKISERGQTSRYNIRPGVYVHRGDSSRKYHILYLKVAKIGLKSIHPKEKKIVTLCGKEWT